MIPIEVDLRWMLMFHTSFMKIGYENIFILTLLLIQEELLSVGAKNVHLVHVTSPWEALPGTVARITDQPDLILAFDHGNKQTNKFYLISFLLLNLIDIF